MSTALHQGTTGLGKSGTGTKPPGNQTGQPGPWGDPRGIPRQSQEKGSDAGHREAGGPAALRQPHRHRRQPAAVPRSQHAAPQGTPLLRPCSTPTEVPCSVFLPSSACLLQHSYPAGNAERVPSAVDVSGDAISHRQHRHNEYDPTSSLPALRLPREAARNAMAAVQ